MDDAVIAMEFEADVESAVASVRELAEYAQDLSDAAAGAQGGLDDMRDSATEAGGAAGQLRDDVTGASVATDGLRDSSGEADTTLGGVRDRLGEAAATAGIYRDEMGKLRDVQAEAAIGADLEATALGHVRDKAAEAALAVRALKDEKESASGTSLLAGLLGGAESGAGGGGGLSAIPLLGPLMEAPQLLVALLPLIMAVVTWVGALATGFAAAGLGVGAFAALAMPAFKQVFGALGDTKAQLAKLPEPIQQAVNGVKSLEDGFSKMSKAFEPTAFKVLNEGLKIANQLLPYVGQFANAAAPAIETLLGNLSKGLDSPAFKHFMGFLESLSGPVITAVGSGMSGLAKDVMQLMESFSKKDVINAVNIAFRLIGFALTALIGIIRGSMSAWDLTTQGLHEVAAGFDVVRHFLAEMAHDFANDFDTIRHAVATGAHDVDVSFDTVRHAIATAGHDIATTFDAIRGDVAKWASDVVGFFEKLPGRVVTEVKKLYDDVLSWAKKIFTDFIDRERTGLDSIISWFEGLPGRVMSAVDSLPGKMLSYGKDIVNGLINGVKSMAGTLITAIEDLIPSPIRSVVSTALGILSPSTVFHGYGQNIVQGLINGVREMQPHLHAAMQEMTGGVTGIGSAYAAGAIAPASGSGPTVHVNVPVTAAGTAVDFTSPQYKQALQAAVQQVTLEYAQMNATNGLTPGWGH